MRCAAAGGGAGRGGCYGLAPVCVELLCVDGVSFPRSMIPTQRSTKETRSIEKKENDRAAAAVAASWGARGCEGGVAAAGSGCGGGEREVMQASVYWRGSNIRPTPSLKVCFRWRAASANKHSPWRRRTHLVHLVLVLVVLALLLGGGVLVLLVLGHEVLLAPFRGNYHASELGE